jgi:phosphatidylserine decarboxylase
MSQTFAALQRLLPHHALSRATGRLARSQAPWIKRPFIHAFARLYRVNMAEAERPELDDYLCFNDFFTRSLRPGARPPDPDPRALLCPADGTISQAGRIHEDRLLQAKGNSYSLRGLLAEDVAELHGGSFVTVYLAPRDYHRVHLPAAGKLISSTSIPGALFSVNARTEAAVSGLFCRNERLVCRFETDFGPMLMVLVGAMIVASIETVWDETPSPYVRQQRRHWNLAFDRGAEIGRFLLGSTVIVCCPAGAVELDPKLGSGLAVKVGQRLGRLT